MAIIYTLRYTGHTYMPFQQGTMHQGVQQAWGHTRSSAASETAWPEAARSEPSLMELATRFPMAFASPVELV